MSFFAFVWFCAPVQAAEVQEVVSPGGITAWLVEDHSLPMLSLSVAFRDAGNLADPDGREGRAELAAELLMEGAGKYDAEAFRNALADRAISLDFSASPDTMNVRMTSLTEHVPTAFSLLGEALARPRFAPASVEEARRRALTELAASEKQPDYLLSRRFAEAAFGSHPYARPAGGTKESLKRLARKDFSDYHARYLTRGNLIVAVAGDMTPEALKPLLDKAFSQLPREARPERSFAEAVFPEKEEVLLAPREIPQTRIAFALPGLKRDDPAYLDAFVLAHIVGGDATSRFYREVREREGLAYGASAMLSPFLHGALFTGQFATRASEAGRALSVVKRVLSDIAQNGVTQAEIDDAKRYLTASFVLALDTNNELASFLIAMQMYGLGKDYLKVRNDRINAVTRESVNAVARRIVQPSRLRVAIVGDPAGMKEKAPAAAQPPAKAAP